MSINVIDRQNLLDIALQVYGNPTGIFTLAIDNNISITDQLVAGTTLTVPEDQERVNPDVLNFYKTYKVKPVTATQEEEQANTASGIGVMQLVTTFKVG